ncbi:hypothetical protein [Cutibacterium sp.]|uniref:hypothetical protein n=1 Tax=Cutibacterium sp. TaxID=1912221 RepID=UPI0026DBF004|nr:hypothetical protein [Cutibacterium sp.]MDO4413055.1 hypothetical protein [Cutibacterium sp.]
MSIHSVEQAATERQAAYQRLREQVRLAQANGVPDAAIARAAGVTAETVRRWTGKSTPNRKRS